MCTRRAKIAANSDETVLNLLRDMEMYEKKEAGADSLQSTCKNMNLIASHQPTEAACEHLKLLILKLRRKSSAACLEVVKCYLELGLGDIHRCFAENGGFCAIGSSFEEMDKEERQIVCDIVGVTLSKYGAGSMDVLTRKICKVPVSEMLEILRLCVPNLALSFVFEDNYLEWLMQQTIRRCLGMQAAEFLAALYASSTLDQKIVIKYFLAKTEFFRHVSCADVLKEEIRRTAPCRPVLSSVALDDRLRGILEIVDSLGLCNFIVFMLESLLFEPERFLKDVEEKFIKPAVSGRPSEASGQGHPKINESNDNTFDVSSGVPGSSDISAGVKQTSPGNADDEQRGATSTAEKAGAVVHTIVRGPPKRRASKRVAHREMPDLSRFQKSYVPLRWVKTSAGKNVWRSVSLIGMESLFSAEDLLPFEKSNSSTKEQTSSVIIQPVIDAKKNNAMNIALSRVKHTDAELKHLILGLELGDENLVRQLLHNFPTAEELEALDRREKGFGRAEEFFKECQGVTEQLKDALCSLHFISVLGSQSVSNAIGVLERFYKSVMESKALVELLQILLFLGNVLNSNTVLGNADGFSLDDMGVFARVRGKNRKSILDVALKRFSRRTELRENLSLLNAAAQVGLDGVEQDMCEIRNCYAKVRSAENAKTAAAIDEYTCLVAKYESFKKLHEEFEAFVGTKADSDFYSSLSIVYKEL